MLAVSGDIEPGQERYPTAEVYPAAEIPAILARLRRGEGYVAAVDSPGLDAGERESLLLSGKESHVGCPMRLYEAKHRRDLRLEDEAGARLREVALYA